MSGIDDLSLRDRVFARDGYRCVYCGIPFPGEQLSLDHVQPRMRGGDNSEGNLVTCCRECNRSKAGLAAWQYLSSRPEVRMNFLTAVEQSDTAHAKQVWARLIRAIREAAE